MVDDQVRVSGPGCRPLLVEVFAHGFAHHAERPQRVTGAAEFGHEVLERREHP
jgi:hypothetical protein